MENEDLLRHLGIKIRDLRKAKNITQAQLAHSIGKDQQSIQRLEAGKVNPSFLYLLDIASGLDLSIGELFRE